MDEHDATRYRFGPLERRGLVAGLRGGQIAAIASGLVVAVLALRSHATALGAGIALLSIGTGVFAATWPLSGRTAEEWAPDAVRFALARQPRREPPALSGLDLIPVELNSEIAVVRDRRSATYTTAFRARSSGFVLLGSADKALRVDAWGTLLSSLASDGSAIHRIQWVQRSFPDDRPSTNSEEGARDEGAGIHSAGNEDRNWDFHNWDFELPLSTNHEVLLAVTVSARRSQRLIRASGGGIHGACVVLMREVATLRRRLVDAAVEPEELLGPKELRDFVAASYEKVPYEPSHEVKPHMAANAGKAGASNPWPYPMGVKEQWDHFRTDATLHVTYWIAEWPRTEVGADFLGPLLLSEVRHSISLVMEPVGPIAASRRTEQARTAEIADDELRRRGGFLSTARRRREQELLAHREVELADGHGHYRFTGYVTVTATGPEELDDNCRRMEQAAARCGLVLRRCYGAQAKAFTCTLPLGRGLA